MSRHLDERRFRLRWLLPVLAALTLTIGLCAQNKPKSKTDGIKLLPFTFTVAHLNADGKIVERASKRGRYYAEPLPDGIHLDMVEIPGGTFQMGSRADEVDRFIAELMKHVKEQFRRQVEFLVRWEVPQHSVTISSFFMGKYEITQEQWRAVASLPQVRIAMDPSHSFLLGGTLPADHISWADAVEFCERLSQATGRKYRLPTEAEWEYAARAGTTTPFAFGDSLTTDVANFQGTGQWGTTLAGIDRKGPIIVGSLGYANAFGLYDMHGNVWEWCMDWNGQYLDAAVTDPRGTTKGNSGHYRGGGWDAAAAYSRSAARSSSSQESRGISLGFRVVCGE